jgi:hypothetical protein
MAYLFGALALFWLGIAFALRCPGRSRPFICWLCIMAAAISSIAAVVIARTPL